MRQNEGVQAFESREGTTRHTQWARLEQTLGKSVGKSRKNSQENQGDKVAQKYDFSISLSAILMPHDVHETFIWQIFYVEVEVMHFLIECPWALIRTYQKSLHKNIYFQIKCSNFIWRSHERLMKIRQNVHSFRKKMQRNDYDQHRILKNIRKKNASQDMYNQIKYNGRLHVFGFRSQFQQFQGD